jgi:putative transposase
MYPKYLKYKAKSIRLLNYDYSRYGAYDITICAYGRDCIFGHIADGRMFLNSLGRIANDFWREIPRHFPMVKLGRYQVMPKHVHGVLFISRISFFCRDTACRVSTKKIDRPTREAFSKPTNGSISTIIRSYKAAVTRAIRIPSLSPDSIIWQRGYYEHIIGDKKELWATSTYIRNNPKNWKNDEYYKT